MSLFGQASATPSNTSSLFSFGTAQPNASLPIAANTTTSNTPSNTSLFNLNTTSTVPTLGPTATTTTATTAATASNTNNMTFKQLEEQINGWMRDLDDQEKEFLEQACQLNGLDRVMIENGEKIVDLNNEVDRLNNEQDKLEQELDFIMTQQSYLEQSLSKLELSLEQIPIMNTSSIGDKDRIYTYQLLLQIDNQLKTMSNDLKDIITRLNKTQLVNLNDPSIQISKILNAHMDSLTWVEDNSLLIQKQIDLVTRHLNDKLNTSVGNNPSANTTGTNTMDRSLLFNYY